MEDLVGKVIADRYFVRNLIGRGGMSEVYLVWDKMRSTQLAMKVLHEDLALDRIILRRFQREAAILSKLTHPNIVRFYGFEQAGEISFILTDYIDGDTLKKIIFDQKGPLPLNVVGSVINSATSALNYAHQSGIVHADIKSSNIFISNQGNVYVADFGIARIADTATTISGVSGTPAYMAPEQILGESISYSSDQFALGIVLYEMVTGGERPFSGERASITGTASERIRWEHLHSDPIPPREYNPDLSESLEQIILRSLNKNPNERFGTMLEFRDSVIGALGNKKATEYRISTQRVSTVPVQQAAHPKGRQIPCTIIVISSLSLVSFIAILWILQELNFFQSLIGVLKDVPWIYVGIGAGVLALTTIFIRTLSKKRFSKLKKHITTIPKLDVTSTEVTANLISELNPNKQRELIRLIGRDREMRIKDIIVHFGGGRYLLRGFGRFGATALIEQIIEYAKSDLSQSNKNNDGSVVIAVRVEFTKLDEPGTAFSAIIREFRFEARRGKFARSITKRLEKIQKNRIANITGSSQENTVSIKASPIPGIETSFSRKTGNEKGYSGSERSVSYDELLNLVSEVLDMAGKSHKGILEATIGRLLNTTKLPSRVIIIVDQIFSENVFEILQTLRIFDDSRITFFAIVRQDEYLKWADTTFQLIDRLGFRSHYIPCLWEEETDFINQLITETTNNEIDRALYDNFRHHIAFLSRGAPGDIVKEILSHEYSSYRLGTPVLKLNEIRNKDLVEYNARRQKILSENWDQILQNHFIGLEEKDQAKVGIYEIIDWMHQRRRFSWNEILDKSGKVRIPIAQSKALREDVLNSLLNILNETGYLGISDNKYQVLI